jgi:ferrochelatase
MLTDTVAKMAEDGIRRALAFVTSAYSNYSSCRQYREDIQKACDRAGASAPQIDKLRAFYDHPGFIEPLVECVADALQQIPADRRGATAIVYTAHSIPVAMSRGCKYVAQLTEVCRLIGEHVGDRPWQLAYQSRSGPARQPWLEPDVCDYLKGLHKGKGVADVVIAPIGFISDHMEVLFDLDTEARALCDSLGINMVRAQTVGTHPRFVRMIRELIEERTSDCSHREALGCLGPSHDTCPQDCCPSGRASDLADRSGDTSAPDSPQER